jgi:hypothetical protein
MQGNGLSTTIYIEKVRRERMKLKMERKHWGTEKIAEFNVIMYDFHNYDELPIKLFKFP